MQANEHIISGEPVISMPEVKVTVVADLLTIMDDGYAKQAAFLQEQAKAAPVLHFVLAQIMGSLPENKDWLDPVLERLANEQLAKLAAVNPKLAVLKV